MRPHVNHALLGAFFATGGALNLVGVAASAAGADFSAFLHSLGFVCSVSLAWDEAKLARAAYRREAREGWGGLT
jgi:hypothetical protein